MTFQSLPTELTIAIYCIKALVCGFGFIIFAWWWIRQRTASMVFAYITFLLLAASIENSLSAYLESQIYENLFGADRVLRSWLWSIRTLPTTVIYFIIVKRLSVRACRTIRLEKKYRSMGEPECQEDFRDGSD